ncbi:glycerol-3-phosphate ABC transporter permease [Pullulanibacillus camelliae]|uniref:Glycerol-3-phosphate ABC transporter permease n=1 Tax=Pullulanibacillus camelliae TaxID=1707096 RepID=A0A8J2YAP9_9BACL|nr:carbohydrate ABC transporter permease [Pullulanibacillus camelliae]GGE29917.1 glycerol-3-phosphate ABC transporter permease [Pullulanibacillus camelliae]
MKKRMGTKLILYILLILAALLVGSPLLLGLSLSLMPQNEILAGQYLPKTFSLQNYLQAFQSTQLVHYLINSLIVSLAVMIGQLLLSSLAAYAFVFPKFRGQQLCFYLFISTMMIPFEAQIIPNFQTIRDLNWLNTYPALVIPFVASVFGTFLLRQNFKQLPNELKEASDIIGLSHWTYYLKIVLPMSKVSLVTLGTYSFLTTWNMYLWPLLASTNDAVRTVQIGLKQMQSQETLNQWGVIMACAITIAIPTLLVLFLGQKHLQKGLTEGAIK